MQRLSAAAALATVLLLTAIVAQQTAAFTFKFNFGPERDQHTSSAAGRIVGSDPTALGTTAAPLLSATNARQIANKYLILLKDHVDADAHHASLSERLGALASNGVVHRLLGKFSIGARLKGYVGHFDDLAVNFLRMLPDVAYVERDQEVKAYATEDNAPWGLARISHRGLPLPAEANAYHYDSAAGAGVWAYVVDTGINTAHVDFEGRAVWGRTIPDGDEDRDGNGHGTHVAGTIGGRRYGVAKNATLVAVKVLRSDGTGTLSDVVLGIDWAVNNHTARVNEYARANQVTAAVARKKVKSVANMSLGGGASRALDAAVDAAVEAGVHFAVAAGNDDADACNYSPAASKNAITVGATTNADARAWFSNHGRCVDILAPGHQILSAWIGGPTETNVISGTSMASPHVAGLLALWASEERFSEMSADTLKDQVIAMSTKGMITSLPKYDKTKNRLLYSDPPETD